jgi:hypothetical protein
VRAVAGPVTAAAPGAPGTAREPGDPLDVAPGRGLALEAPAELVPSAHRGGFRRQKGAILQADRQAVPGRRLIGLDEREPVSAKPSAGEVWKEGLGRATVAPACGRRGRGWVVGACEPASGLATTRCRPRRARAHVNPRWEPGLPTAPARAWGSSWILSVPPSREPPALLAGAGVELWGIPTEACGLHLMAPWWQQLRRLARKGRRVPTSTRASRPWGRPPGLGVSIAIRPSGKSPSDFGNRPLSATFSMHAAQSRITSPRFSRAQGISPRSAFVADLLIRS